MLSFLLVLHTRCWLSILSLLFFSSKDMKEVAGAEEWLYLISLFVKSKLFLRNQAPDFPLHLSDHNVAMLRKASLCHFGLLLWEGEFLTRKKRMGMIVSRKTSVTSMAALKKNWWHVCG